MQKLGKSKVQDCPKSKGPISLWYSDSQVRHPLASAQSIQMVNLTTLCCLQPMCKKQHHKPLVLIALGLYLSIRNYNFDEKK